MLYKSGERTFEHNGIGPLSSIIDIYVDRQTNGIYELVMTYPIGGPHYENLCNGRIILATAGPSGQSQPFEIYRITKTSKRRVTVYAQHVAYQLKGITVTPFAAPTLSTALSSLKDLATTACPFEFRTDRTTEGEFALGQPSAIWDVLGGTKGSILDCYGGEYDFDRYIIYQRSRLGTDNGVTIRYGKNLQSLEQDESIANTWTGVHPYWQGQDGTLVTLPEHIVLAKGNYAHTRIKTLNLSSEWTEPPTVEQLRERTNAYIVANDIGKPTVSLRVEFIHLDQTVEYAHLAPLERVSLGDTVGTIFPELDVDVSARVVYTRWDPVRERYKWVQIGSVKSNLASTIADQQHTVEELPTIELSREISETIAKIFLGVSGGAVRFLDTNGDKLPDEIYIADNVDPALAVEVWRLNHKGWAASNNGYNGPFIMGATLADGLLAHSITAAQIRAGFIRSADGNVEINLDSGLFRVKSVDEIYKYFHMTVDGFVIGEAGSPANVILGHDEITIELSGEPVIRFDAMGRGWIPRLIVPELANICGLQTYATDTHVNCDYVPITSISAEAAVAEPLALMATTSEDDGLTRSGSFRKPFDGGDYVLQVEWSVEPTVAGGTFVPTLKIYLLQTVAGRLSVGSRSDNVATIAGKAYIWTSSAVRNTASDGSSVRRYLGTVVGEPVAYTASGSVEVSVGYNIRATISGTYYETVTAIGTVSALDYTPPKITALKAVRCNADGTPNQSGTYAVVTFSATVAPVSNTNTAAYAVLYRPTEADSYTTHHLPDYAGQYTVTAATAIIPADPKESYEIIVQVTDKYAEPKRRSVPLGAEEHSYSWLKDGGKLVALAIGTIAKIKGAVELAWVLRPSRGIGMPSTKVSTLAEADEALVRAYAALADRSIGHLCIITTVAIDTLGGGNWIVTMSRYTSQYGSAEAVSYHTNPPTKLSRRLYDGTWDAWS